MDAHFLLLSYDPAYLLFPVHLGETPAAGRRSPVEVAVAGAEGADERADGRGDGSLQR